MHYLTTKLWFPHPSEATLDGLLAVGGDLSEERLLLAYRSGIFPWYEEDQPVLWWSPNPRMILFPSNLKVSKSFQKVINSKKYNVTFNTHFSEVIKNCASIKREAQGGTWITTKMQHAYTNLHKAGHAVSVEVWEQDKLVGGLYGIDLPELKVFCGESMFSKKSDASKLAFYELVQKLKSENYRIIDCQLHTDHLESLGAEEMEREDFLKFLKR